MPEYYIGLISGTSMDGIDAVLAQFHPSSMAVVCTRAHPYPDELRDKLVAAIREPKACGVDDIGMLDRWTGECFRDAVFALLDDAGIDAANIKAIGSHGQTLRHQPDATHPFTMQIGDPAMIATATGIATVADFRRADVALGGQGAPLLPTFHEWLFRDKEQDRVVLNIGGIANVTILPAGEAGIAGFDTGPGNTLLDAWIRQHHGTAFDEDGRWASSGRCDADLLARLLDDPYFAKAPPKSTGPEYFNLDWLRHANTDDLAATDVQATLCELTAVSISNAVKSFSRERSQVLVCGGGIHNPEIQRRLGKQMPQLEISSTANAGLDPDWVEASAFAWLAMRTLKGQTGNHPAVTGASRFAVLGAIYPGAPNAQ
jgi:anhydro-N-acetylmuramic acid kinase